LPRITLKTAHADDDMLPEYDFSGAVSGKCHERFRRSSADPPQGVPHCLCRFDQIRHQAFVDVRRPLVLRQISALMGLGEDPPGGWSQAECVGQVWNTKNRFSER
jgi:hypothetical protein